MGQDHSLQAEIERFVKAAASDPRIAAAQPGEPVVMDTTALSLYIHIPTVNGLVGMNINSVTLARPTS